MAKYRVRDIKKVNKIHSLDLKKRYLNLPDNNFQTNKNFYSNKLNLKPLNNDIYGLWCGESSLFVDSVNSTKTKVSHEMYNLVPREKIENPFRSGIAAVFRFSLAGLLILIFINYFNIISGGKELKNILISSASSGLNNVLSGVENGTEDKFDAAETEFLRAKGHFNLAAERLSFLRTSNVFGEDRDLKSLKELLAAGQSISEAGRLFVMSAKGLQNWPALFLKANRNIIVDKISIENNSRRKTESLTDSLAKDLRNINLAIDKLSDANNHLSFVNTQSLPPEYRKIIEQIGDNLADFEKFLREISEHFPAILKLLGDRYPHRYLILLQNDTESRPTGGFIGSIMIVDINDGLITRADFHDVYKFDGQLHEYIEAPEDISMITNEWRLRDSNYSPDFAISAEKAAWFLQKSKGPSVDTVIAINQSAVLNILNKIGPIKVPGLKSELDANNFQFILSYLVESKYFSKQEPKKIISNTIESFKSKILETEDTKPLLDALLSEIKAGKILFYSRDTEIRELFEKLNLTPHQVDTLEKEDFLQVVTTSVGGNKSDKYIDQTFVHSTFIDSLGELTNELSISRKHNWNEEELNKWSDILKKFGFPPIPENVQNILGRGVNRSSIKVYVPLGSKLENAMGINVEDVITRHDSELNKTYFLFFMDISPGNENKIVLRYKLPWRLELYPADIYRFTAQKQLALHDSFLKKEIILSPNLKILKNTQNEDEQTRVLNGIYKMRAILSD